MTSEDFVSAFYREKEHLLKLYLDENSEPKTAVEAAVKDLNLTPEQRRGLKRVFDLAFTDVFYSFLLALDGSTSIGGSEQQLYDLKSENGTQLSGDLEGFAFEYFQGTVA